MSLDKKLTLNNEHLLLVHFVLLIFSALFVATGCQVQKNLPSQEDVLPTSRPKTSSEGLPIREDSLIFLVEGKVQLWNYATSQVETLLSSNILQYSLSENGQNLVAARQTGSNPDKFEFVYLDLSNFSSRILLDEVYCLHNFSISPNGRHLLYIADDFNLEKQLCQADIKLQDQEAKQWVHSSPFSHKLGGAIYILDMENNSSREQVGNCEENANGDHYLSQFSLCVNAYWTPDSQNFIWFDAAGIWLTNLGSNQTNLLYPLFENGEDHLYSDITWSPNGIRFMTRGESLSGNGAQRVVLDWRTGERIEAPYSDYWFAGVRPYVIWLGDNELFFTKPMAVAETWEIMPNENQFGLKESLNLASNDSDFIATSLHQFPNGTISYALLSPYSQNRQEHGLYSLESLNDDPELIINLPQINNYADDVNVLWSPYGNQAVIEYFSMNGEGEMEKQFYLASISTEMLEDITGILGETAVNLQFLP